MKRLLAAADDAVYIQVLGVAQDAGYPQANCYKPHCMRAWEEPELQRGATSLAVVDERQRSKYLFDATPDMREQLYELHKSAPDDYYRLGGVFLTHAHIGHYAGLVHFGHEAAGTRRVPVYAMPRLYEYLSTNGPWDQLVRFENIELRALADDQTVEFVGSIAVTPFVVPHRDEYSETVGYRIEGPNKHPFVRESMTLFESMSAEERRRVIFIHMNHTNPLLYDGSPEQAEVTRRGFRFAREGMRLDL